MKRTLAALLAAVLVFAALCVCLPVSAETVNVAKGKSYVISQQFRQSRVTWGWDDNADIAYPDTDGVELTDGIFAAEDSGYGDDAWIGFHGGCPEYKGTDDKPGLGYSYMRVDLGEVYTLSELIIYVGSKKLGSGITAPTTVEFYVSEDGETYTGLGEITPEDTDETAVIAVSQDTTAKARYVEIRMKREGNWMFVTEFEAYADVSSGPSDPTDVRVETSELTALNETAPASPDEWYTNGTVVAITNDGSEEKTITSGDYAMRYLYILVFDGNGACVEIGNNLFSADDPRANEFPQHDVVIPAGGFVILFYYNVDNNANQALFDYYADLGGTELYNETQKITTTYSAELKENSVVLYFGAKSAPETPSEPVMIGDINLDGKIDAVDYMLLKRYCLGTYMLYDERLAAADIDGNGVVNATDYALLKRVVLGTFPNPNTYPPETVSAGDEPAFALDLQSSIAKNEEGKRILTAVLTVSNIGEGVRLTELFATLSYDPAQLKLLNEYDLDKALDCVTKMPDRWGNMTTLGEDGTVNVCVLNDNDYVPVLTLDDNVELIFTFELAEGCTEATVSIASETVEGVYADGESKITLYNGQGAFTTAWYVETDTPDPDPTEPDPTEPDPTEPETPEPTIGDIFGDGKIDATDYMMLKRAVLGTSKLTDEQMAVADINKDGKVDSTDYIMLKRAVLGTYVIK